MRKQNREAVLECARRILDSKVKELEGIVEAAIAYEDAQTAAWHDLADALTGYRVAKMQRARGEKL